MKSKIKSNFLVNFIQIIEGILAWLAHYKAKNRIFRFLKNSKSQVLLSPIWYLSLQNLSNYLARLRSYVKDLARTGSVFEGKKHPSQFRKWWKTSISLYLKKVQGNYVKKIIYFRQNNFKKFFEQNFPSKGFVADQRWLIANLT